jgi:hypothetical protein
MQVAQHVSAQGPLFFSAQLNLTADGSNTAPQTMNYFDLDRDTRASVRKRAVRVYLNQNPPWFQSWLDVKKISKEQMADATEFVVDLLNYRLTTIWTNAVSAAGSKRKVAETLDDGDYKCECGEVKVWICPACDDFSKVPTPTCWVSDDQSVVVKQESPPPQF